MECIGIVISGDRKIFKWTECIAAEGIQTRTVRQGCKLTAKISGVEIISLMLSRLSRAGTKNGRLLLYVSVNINNERMGSLYLSYQCFVIALLLLVSGFDQQERFPKV